MIRFFSRWLCPLYPYFTYFYQESQRSSCLLGLGTDCPGLLNFVPLLLLKNHPIGDGFLTQDMAKEKKKKRHKAKRWSQFLFKMINLWSNKFGVEQFISNSSHYQKIKQANLKDLPSASIRIGLITWILKYHAQVGGGSCPQIIPCPRLPVKLLINDSGHDLDSESSAGRAQRKGSMTGEDAG